MAQEAVERFPQVELEVELAAFAVDGHHDREVAVVLIAIDRRFVAALEARVPHADAVHHHVGWVAARAVLDVVAAHEEGQRQTVLPHGAYRDAAEPPGTVGVGHLDVDLLVFGDVSQFPHVVLLLDRAVRRMVEDVGDVFVLQRRLFEREHRAVDERVLVVLVGKREQVERALEALGEDLHVVVHQQNVRVARGTVHGLHHAARKTARAAHVEVCQHGNAAVGKLRRIEGAAVIDHKQVEAARDGLVAAQDIALNRLDVGEDELLFAKRGRGNRQIDRADPLLIDHRVEVRAGHACLVLAHELEADERRRRIRQLDIDDLRICSGCDLRERCLRGTERAVLPKLLEHDVAGGTGKLEVEPDVVDRGVLAPLRIGKGVEIRQKVDLAGEGKRTPITVGARHALAAVEQLGVLHHEIIGGEQDVCKLEMCHSLVSLSTFTKGLPCTWKYSEAWSRFGFTKLSPPLRASGHFSS